MRLKRGFAFGWFRWSAIVGLPISIGLVLSVLAWWGPWVQPALFQTLLVCVVGSYLWVLAVGLWDAAWLGRRAWRQGRAGALSAAGQTASDRTELPVEARRVFLVLVVIVPLVSLSCLSWGLEVFATP